MHGAPMHGERVRAALVNRGVGAGAGTGLAVINAGRAAGARNGFQKAKKPLCERAALRGAVAHNALEAICLSFFLFLERALAISAMAVRCIFRAPWCCWRHRYQALRSCWCSSDTTRFVPLCNREQNNRFRFLEAEGGAPIALCDQKSDKAARARPDRGSTGLADSFQQSCPQILWTNWRLSAVFCRVVHTIEKFLNGSYLAGEPEFFLSFHAIRFCYICTFPLLNKSVTFRYGNTFPGRENL